MDDEFISLNGFRFGKLSLRPGMGKVQGGYIGPNGGLGALPTTGTLVGKPKPSKPPENGKKD